MTPRLVYYLESSSLPIFLQSNLLAHLTRGEKSSNQEMDASADIHVIWIFLFVCQGIFFVLSYLDCKKTKITIKEGRRQFKKCPISLWQKSFAAKQKIYVDKLQLSECPLHFMGYVTNFAFLTYVCSCVNFYLKKKAPSIWRCPLNCHSLA